MPAMVITYLVRWTVLTLLLLRPGQAQQWQETVNISMCNWADFRGNVIRDTIYLNGGSLWWKRFIHRPIPPVNADVFGSGFSDGTYGTPQSDGNVGGTFFSLSLTEPFNVATDNVTRLFSRNLQPDWAPVNFESGTMFATDNEFLLFGGLTRQTDSTDVPGAREIVEYERYSQGSSQGPWASRFTRSELPSPMSRYITYGAGVSVPSEDLGFYFGGMRGPDWGPITTHDGSANTSAATMVTVDLSRMGDARWTNDTLPEHVATRASAQMVWLPYGARGILAVIGGVTHLQDVYPAPLSPAQVAENERTGAGFLTTIPIYDIANAEWYVQNTTGNPPPATRAAFCTAVASAPDGSSHNIYVYEGYDGTTPEPIPYDDVYILSLPSFTWVRGRAGVERHGRRAHQCIQVFPDQMLVLGGVSQDPTVCIDGGVIQIFNLSTLQFQDAYDPDTWSEYRVPPAVVEQLGGRYNAAPLPDRLSIQKLTTYSARGGANRTAPEAWHDPRLAAVFDHTYTKPVRTWYPYGPSDADPTPSATGAASASDGRTPAAWRLPVLLGVLLPTVLAAVVGALCCARWRTTARPTRDCGRHGWRARWLARVGFPTCSGCPSEVAGSPVDSVASPTAPPMAVVSEKVPDVVSDPAPVELPTILEESPTLSPLSRDSPPLYLDSRPFSFAPTPVEMERKPYEGAY
ncbi:hypothetical protein FE257_002189 [Aspergillus nanangensis]|uniref:Kelch repeat protein n=1 Tax=Aspergillus nanangensis TaxID=2582783 RepID=A0AAD4CDC4_ASPNN|nr:hypothetical protein FE257_002189 [Aspergillus nanangensis]